MNIRNELFDILAVTDILTSIEIKNPEMHIVNVQIAYIIETYNHRKSALKYYRQFLKKNGNSCTNSEIYLRMGKIFETLKDEENAKKAYIKAYESNKENIRALYKYIDYMGFHEQKYEWAIIAYKNIIERCELLKTKATYSLLNYNTYL